jgi:hypothetical protein
MDYVRLEEPYRPHAVTGTSVADDPTPRRFARRRHSGTGTS